MPPGAVVDGLRAMGAMPAQHVIPMTIFDLADRYRGIKELPGALQNNPVIMAMLKLTKGADFSGWPKSDEVPWCSGAMNWWAWHLRLPRSYNLQARSWLDVGRPITLEEAVQANDVLILKRGSGKGTAAAHIRLPDGTWPPGHVTLFAGMQSATRVLGLGGNQGDTVSIASYPTSRLIGVRRLF